MAKLGPERPLAHAPFLPLSESHIHDAGMPHFDFNLLKHFSHSISVCQFRRAAQRSASADRLPSHFLAGLQSRELPACASLPALLSEIKGDVGTRDEGRRRWDDIPAPLLFLRGRRPEVKKAADQKNGRCRTEAWPRQIVCRASPGRASGLLRKALPRGVRERKFSRPVAPKT
ncbi:hypothetical protein GQ53DRAFT_751727 [Thozetella sp. PMI_491]|nr:hypothetical protein GQ53DRAFT_751727 [Thozetella sp. PMI_491]